MTTKRTPLDRGRRRVITAGALDAFRAMLDAAEECICEPINWEGEYWRHRPCKACERRSDAHWVLHKELGGKPWDGPIVSDPDAINPYPIDSHAYHHWNKDREADPASIELFKELLALVESGDDGIKATKSLKKKELSRDE